MTNIADFKLAILADLMAILVQCMAGDKHQISNAKSQRVSSVYKQTVYKTALKD